MREGGGVKKYNRVYSGLHDVCWRMYMCAY